MKKLLKLTALVCAVIMLFGVMSVYAGEGDAAVSDETLVVGHFGEPVCLYTIKQTNMHTIPVANLIYDGLTRLDPETREVVPCIAESWELIDDTTWQFHIRPGIIAADGSELTADDILYTFTEGQTYQTSPTWSDIDLEKCEVIDTYTINIVTYHPMAFLPKVLSNGSVLPMVSKSAVEAAGGPDACMRNPVCGTGPYTFKEWVDGEYITLERNENYWGEKPYYKTIQMRFISDNATRVMELEAGSVDAILNVPISQVDYLDSNPDYTVFNIETDLSYEMFFNATFDGPCSDVRVRRAIAMMINQEGILMAAGGGYGVAMDCTNIAPSNPYYVAPSAEELYPYDVEAAKALLAEAGYPDGFDMKLTTMAMYANIVDIVQASLAQIGINVIIDTVDMATLIQGMNTGNFEVMMGSEIPAGDLSYPLHKYDTRLTWSEVQGSTGWGSDELNELIDKAAYSLDESEAAAAYAQVQAILRENVPIISFYCYNAIYASKASITGLTTDTRGMAYLRYARPVE